MKANLVPLVQAAVVLLVVVKRRRFWARSLKFAGEWLTGGVDHIGRLLTVLGILGFPVALVVITGLPRWMSTAGIALVILTALEEGTFRAWREEGTQHLELAQKVIAVNPPPTEHIEQIKAVADRYRRCVDQGDPLTADNDKARSEILRRCFEQHYPGIGPALTTWDAAARRLQAAKADVNQIIGTPTRLGADSATLGSWLQALAMMATWSALVNSIAHDPAKVAQLEWSVVDGQLRIAENPLMPGFMAIAPMPGTTLEQLALLERLSQSIERVADGPEGRDLRQAESAIESLKPALIRDLTRSSMAHGLPEGTQCGICDGLTLIN